jgi:hypothetical protein
MLATSSAFLASLRGSHVVAINATLYVPGQAPVAVPVQPGGEIAIDRTARNRRAGSVLVPWTIALEQLGLEPDVRTLPFGSYCRVRRGLRYASSSELVVLGHLRVESVAWSTTEGVARLELADRMAQVADEPLLSPYAPAGLYPSDAAVALVTAVFGGTITYSVTIPTSAQPLLTDVVYTNDRAAAVEDLAQAIGGQAYFDELGNFRLDPLPDPSTQTPVFTIDAGASGVMVSAEESLDRTALANGVLVQGQQDANAPPISALVVDSNPASPTLWGGPFGKVARVETSSAVQTSAQAIATATAILNNQLGLERQLTIAMVPNPALVAGDVVTIAFDDGRVETHIVESVRQPLDATVPSTLATRSLWTPTALVSMFESERRRTYYGHDAWSELREGGLV